MLVGTDSPPKPTEVNADAPHTAVSVEYHCSLAVTEEVIACFSLQRDSPDTS